MTEESLVLLTEKTNRFETTAHLSLEEPATETGSGAGYLSLLVNSQYSCGHESVDTIHGFSSDSSQASQRLQTLS